MHASKLMDAWSWDAKSATYPGKYWRGKIENWNIKEKLGKAVKEI